MDKTKLVELRKKNQQKKTKEKQLRKEHDNNVLNALKSIHDSLLKGEKYSAKNTEKLLRELKTISALSKNFEKLERAIENAISNIPQPEAIDTVTVENLPNFAELVPEYDNTEIVDAINSLNESITKNKSQKATDYLPVRRVRRVGNEYLFDDTPWAGGGGAGVVNTSQPAYITLISDDSQDSNITYVGEALPGSSTSDSSWRIQRIDKTSGVSVLYAEGAAKFKHVWDNREGLSYS